MKKILNSQAIGEVKDISSPGYYNRLFLVKIYLIDVYHHLLVHVNFHKYFRFVIAEKSYQFCVLPFGLSTAIHRLTKTLASVVQLLRTQRVGIHAYLDDWIFREKFTRTESPTYLIDHPSVTVFQSNPPSWSQECNCRCPVSTQQSKSNRMTASSIDLTQAVLCLREPPRGLVRHKPGEYNLHFTLPGRQSLSGRRPLHILGWLRSSVRLPSSYHSPLKSPEDQGLPRHHGDSDRLTALVSTVASPTTTTPPTSSHSADRHGSIQYFPNIRRPQFHREPHWLDLAAWLSYQGYPKTTGFPNFCRGHGGWSITWFLQSRLYF